MIEGRRYWLVGASEGLGRALAQALTAAGASVVLSARSRKRLDELAATLDGSAVVPVDVTDMTSVRQAAARIGVVDGVIYNAGSYEPMSAKAWDTSAALAMNEVNFQGAVRVIGETLPRFLETGAGDITLIGSLAGYRGLPKAVGYGASKAALISLAETMRHDLSGTGVTVRVVNPGFVRTRLTNKNDFKMPMLMEPDQAANQIVRSLRSRKFRRDFPAPFSWAMRALNHLPDVVVYRGK